MLRYLLPAELDDAGRPLSVFPVRATQPRSSGWTSSIQPVAFG
jgi:hypothetical protein